jgi:hypothetical protein
LFLEHDKAAIGTKQTEIRDKGQWKRYRTLKHCKQIRLSNKTVAYNASSQWNSSLQRNKPMK